MLCKSKSLLVIAFLIAFPFEVHGQPLTNICNPNSGRATSRVQCLAKITQLLSEQLESMKTELAQYASQTNLSDYAKISDLNQRMASFQSELSQYTKSNELDKYVKASDLNQQLLILKSELTRRPTWADFTGHVSNSNLNQPVVGAALTRHDGDTSGPASGNAVGRSTTKQKVYEGRSSVGGSPGVQGKIGTQSGQVPRGRKTMSGAVQ